MTAMRLNVIDLEKSEYAGGKSSLCPGCGHDQISNVIVQAAWENGIKPEGIAKMSGIGCSSKTPAYFLGKSHGFNTVHGRMPSVTTGANLVNKDLSFIGVSGDGDTASIGIGQFIHAIRKNVDMVYIIENNGVYGLTKVTEDLLKGGDWAVNGAQEATTAETASATATATESRLHQHLSFDSWVRLSPGAPG